MNNISEHVRFNEAIHSQTAERKGIDNTPSPEVLERMIETAENIYEPIVNHFGIEPYISSFFRCLLLNRIVGSKDTSQHPLGEAIDIDCDVYGGITNEELARWVIANLEFDQIIREGMRADGTGGWIHISFRKGRNRKQVLKINF